MASAKQLDEWVSEVIRQLADAGFKVETRDGFPIVPSRRDFLEKKRLLEFCPEVTPPVRKEIWAEGMLFLPQI